MPSKIFVSYRREDDPNAAARVRDSLVRAFGKANVFLDVDNLLAGQRFDEELTEALAQCDVLLAIIGPRWMELLQRRQRNGDRDYVREEIAAALQRKIVVIPVRVGGDGTLPSLPRLMELPEEIRDLAHYQKHDVTYERFPRDIAELIEAITKVLRQRQGKRGGGILSRRQRAASIVAGVALLLSAGGYYGGRWVIIDWTSRLPMTSSTASVEVERRQIADLQAEINRREAALAAAEAERKRIETETAKLRTETEARRKAEEDAHKADETAAAKREADEEARAQAAVEVERKRIADLQAEINRHDLALAAVEAERKRIEAEAAELLADAEARRKTEDDTRKADETAAAKRKTDEEARAQVTAEAERKRIAELQVEINRRDTALAAAEAERKHIETETAKLRAEAEARRKAEEDARKADEAAATKKKEEEEARAQAAEEAERKRIADLQAEIDRRDAALAAIEAERTRTEAEAAKLRADAETRRKAEGDTRKADESAAAKETGKEDRKGAEEDIMAGHFFRDCDDGCPEMVVVPAGSFTMGSSFTEQGHENDEGPQRLVTIQEAFAVGKFEVTFSEWETCVAGGGCQSNRNPSDQGWGKGRRPVITISWNDSQEYVAWLSRKSGQIYRLLSEAEWEYAARAGTVTRYFWGDTVGRRNANCGGCNFERSEKQTKPVGSYKPNAFGLHDMHGNVWEQVLDCWNASYAGAPTDGSARISGDCSRHVIRGGSWYTGAEWIRSAKRSSDPAGYKNANVGFRVARQIAAPR